MGTTARLALGAVCTALLVATPAAHAVPGVPGPTQVLFAEDFENAWVASDDGPATLIGAYTGSGPVHDVLGRPHVERLHDG